MPPGQPDSEGVSQSRIIAAYRCSGLSWIFGEVGVCVLGVELPDNVAVLVRTERVGVDGLNPLSGYFGWYIIGS